MESAVGRADAAGQADQCAEEPDLRLSQERAYHCAAVLNGREMAVTGGYSYNSVVAMAEVANLSTVAVGTGQRWQPLGGGNLLRARYLHACAPLPVSDEALEEGEGMLVAGGFSARYLRSTEVYEPSSGLWSPAGDLNIPRQGARAAVLDAGRVVVLGGFYDGRVFPTTTEEFRPRDRAWQVLAQELQVARRYFALAEVPRSLFGC